MKLPGRLPSVSRFTPEIHLGLLYQRYCDDRWVFDILFLRVEGTRLCSLSFVFCARTSTACVVMGQKGLSPQQFLTSQCGISNFIISFEIHFVTWTVNK